MNLGFLCLVAALILFIVSALGVSSGRVNLLAAGLACLAAAQLAGRVTV